MPSMTALSVTGAWGMDVRQGEGWRLGDLGEAELHGGDAEEDLGGRGSGGSG